jgi:hypothetical protein
MVVFGKLGRRQVIILDVVYVNCICALLKATLLLWSIGLTRLLGCQPNPSFTKLWVGYI